MDAPDATLAHEIGHWIYCKQVWSGELQDMANKAFAQSPLRKCNDENFARGYAMYCERGLGGDSLRISECLLCGHPSGRHPGGENPKDTPTEV